VQLHVGVEVCPQAALDAMEGLNAGGQLGGDALHVGAWRARMARAWRCIMLMVAEAAAEEENLEKEEECCMDIWFGLQ
jgi:hypothetical protein